MENVILLLFLIGTTTACTSGEIHKKKDHTPDTVNELTVVVLGEKEVFLNGKIIPVVSLCDEISSEYTGSDTGVRIELSKYMAAGDLFDVTQALQKSSIRKITISEDASLNILRLELTGNGKVMINDDQISLSALHSHLAALDRSKKIAAYISFNSETPAEDVFFAQKMLAKHSIKTIIRK